MAYRYEMSRESIHKGELVYLAPTWQDNDDRWLLKRYAGDAKRVISSRVYYVEDRVLTEDEHANLIEMERSLGLASFEIVLRLLPVANGFSPRSISKAKLNALWKIECVQYFMEYPAKVESRFVCTPWDLIVARVGLQTVLESNS